MEKIKVVIWDLDETFWEGTLSEGEIRYSQVNHELVVELARRGIVSSICSKNDPEPVRDTLAAHGIDDYFVFPDVSWQPKGERIARLLGRMKLRPQNALFVDDNPMNLEEARFYSPELQTATPEILASLLDDPAARGKSDPELGRLAHYRILERKSRERDEQRTSNEDFLRQSRIVVTVCDDPEQHVDRILELIERTNQLNYTKKRISRDELLELLSDPDVECRFLRVRDRFGDYGVCAFHALRSRELLHFLFSCRILDMGVERWLYARLGHPTLRIRGQVAAVLSTPDDPAVDWIREEIPGQSHGPEPRVRETIEVGRVLLKGGCDLDQIKDFLGARDFDSELNYVTDAGVSAHREHTEMLRAIVEAAPPASLVDRIPFLDQRSYETRLFERGYDAYIYSPLMDYAQGLYQHRQSGLMLPYGDLLLDITDPHRWPTLLGNPTLGFSEDFLEWFADEFIFRGGISPERFAENLKWLRARVPERGLLILLNGAEVPVEHPLEEDRHKLHQVLNRVIDDLLPAHPNLALCDVRPLVESRADVADNIRHYRRMIYRDIAAALRDILAERLEMSFSAAGIVARTARVLVSQSVKNGLRKVLAPFRGR